MMKPVIYICLFTISTLGLYSCQKNAASSPLGEATGDSSEENVSSQFKQYWYQGKAEVASYKLEQVRYGETHKGNAVLIFVTEDFSKSKQVKLDYPSRAGNDKVGVLKLNFTKKFNTGLYPYSMMLSVFTPTDRSLHPNTLKTTMSVQDWCGQVFTQVNLRKDKYTTSAYSYFESEGDASSKIDKVFLEDEIWTVARLDYNKLPTGQFKILPGLFHSRLSHSGLNSLDAEAKMIEEKPSSVLYTLNYPDQKRSLSITIEKAFPHKILAWEETFSDMSGKKLTTKAVLDKTLFTDYWSKHGKEHAYLRDSLNLGDSY